MNTSTIIRRIPVLVKKTPQIPPCCCMQTKVRFRSSLAIADSLEWDTTSPSYSSHISKQEHQDQHHIAPTSEFLDKPSFLSGALDTKAKKQKTKNASRKKTPAIDIENGVRLTDISSIQDADRMRRTYQGQAMVDGRSCFPELEPAPFPKDIHSSMPYINREVSKSATPRTGAGHVHNDLQSFEDLEHNMDSTIYRGTLFEYQTQEILRKTLGIYTQRSAGNGDLGVDLRGTWFLPLSASPKPGDKVRHLKVIIQCKKMASKIGPKFVRELQGSLSFETQPTMAILAVSSDYTRQALLPYAKSLWPMALVVIDTETQECRKLMWNRAAEKVMHGLQIGTRWMSGEDGQLESRPVLCFDGKVLERLPGPYLVEGQDSSNEATKSQAVDYAIPDWNITTTPKSIQIFPEMIDEHESIQERESDEADDDIDSMSSPPQSGYLELLKWHNPSLPPLEQINKSLL